LLSDLRAEPQAVCVLESRVQIRPATTADVPAIHDLIKTHAQRGKMVLRPLDELYATLRSYVVCDIQGCVVGCASTHIFWEDLAELKGLAVADDYQGRGIGSALCQACYREMQRLRVRNLFALTTSPGFFEKLGYRRIPKEQLPRFIWGECVRCPTFPVCNEEAVLRVVELP
jgi:amino-acid N-acetyltransferase